MAPGCGQKERYLALEKSAVLVKIRNRGTWLDGGAEDGDTAS
jgi:hypothetical protein